jgi:hypothetical protein
VATLHITMEEGFEDDEVVVALDGAELLRRSLSTRMQIGRAGAVEATVEPGAHTVSVSARGAAAQIPVEVEDELFLGVSLSRSGDAIEHRVSREPFGYA